MDQEIQSALEKLNALLQDRLPYKLYMARSSEIEFLEKNARYMTKEQFSALTQNIRTDGGLTSLPLCCLREDRKLLVLSGNHRIKAAIEAGVKEILVLLLDQPLTKERQIAIQLSHNAISGQDDEQILKELWQQITDLADSIYSGLSTELIDKLTSAKFTTISEQRVLFKEVSLLFLPEEIDQMTAICEGIVESAKSKIVFSGRITEYDAILDGIIAAKQGQKIINSTLAFFSMAKAVQDYFVGKGDNMQEALEEGVADTVLFTLGGTRKRIKKETAKIFRKAIKERTDAGMSLDSALISITS